MDGRKLRIKPKLIGILIAVLVLIVGVTAWMNANSLKDYGDTELAICVDGEEYAFYTLEELSEKEVTTVYHEFTSKKAEGEKGEWTGLMVTDILEDAGVDINKYETFVFSAGDGYSSAADSDEIGTVMIAWEKDGELLEPFDEGGTGPMRCVFTGESFGQRSIHNVVKINCAP